MPIYITADTAAEASAIYAAKRDRSGEGSKFPCGEWNGLRISYNGRVWNAEGKAIYNPGGTHRLWEASTAQEANG